jgi:hypothetical protein
MLAITAMALGTILAAILSHGYWSPHFDPIYSENKRIERQEEERRVREERNKKNLAYALLAISVATKNMPAIIDLKNQLNETFGKVDLRLFDEQLSALEHLLKELGWRKSGEMGKG